MVNIEQIALQITRLMSEGQSKEQAEKQALETAHINELTEDQRKALDEKLKAHEDAVQDEKEKLNKDTEQNNEEISEELNPVTQRKNFEEKQNENNDLEG